ncbi:MAG TPA: hypothetical protein VME43_18565 [Bryobacteraceae bacterium]|nr:hypothetical protein [Bryobacteraceae bacterium]
MSYTPHGSGREVIGSNRTVFINCPFDPTYRRIFDAIIFAVCSLGFEPRCALEQDTGTQERLIKILNLIEACPYCIHDLSFMTIDPRTRLPRHNMPFELGLFLGYEFASRARPKKSCLILDRERFRYRNSLSDLSGRDVRAHSNSPKQAIIAVRDWLVIESGRNDAPGGAFIVEQYRRFRRQLPVLCKTTKRRAPELSFWDYRGMVSVWLKNT